METRKHLQQEIGRLKPMLHDQKALIQQKENVIADQLHFSKELHESKQMQHNMKETIMQLNQEILDSQ